MVEETPVEFTKKNRQAFRQAYTENIKKNNSIGAVKAQESWFRLSVNQPNPGDIEVIKNFIQK